MNMKSEVHPKLVERKRSKIIMEKIGRILQESVARVKRSHGQQKLKVSITNSQPSIHE